MSGTVAVVDYGVGNLRSAQKALEAAGASRVVVTRDPDTIRRAERVVLPGVGAFGHCIGALREAGLEEAVREAVASGRPFLGICVGMQLLFQQGEEFGVHRGLGVLPGRVVRFPFAAGDGLKVPHMGWSPVAVAEEPPALFAGLPSGTHFYFVHSYIAVDVDPAQVAGWADYGVRFPAAVLWRNVAGTQFHPEKSQAAGLALLRNFLGWRP
ncbi:MAG TPA: imidazole glycerol phosphate synthase subunit HisH [Thermodesulfobacteriota bacterium]|nr:imidazole glycerol phosphate synthase subunit HisH [Thermodesulfobacteriota bacterium]